MIAVGLSGSVWPKAVLRSPSRKALYNVLMTKLTQKASGHHTEKLAVKRWNMEHVLVPTYVSLG
eukprot:scaffold8637_cov92-Cyclotella_meneghiniana.AAC.1